MADPDQDDADGLDNDQEGSFCEDGVRRPMNAFFIFCKRHRDVVREKYPHLENRSITKILGEWWANLDASEKATYTALAKQYKEAFMKAHPDFKWYKLPSAPTRTLITRPSNNRCSQIGKKDKNGDKSALCGIALGKLAGDEQLGSLSSLFLNDSMDPSARDIDSQDASTAVSSSSMCNISKPPKKRYLVNGEFMSKPESYNSQDDRTQNACSALMELAEICVNTANHSISSTQSSDILCNNNSFSPIGSYTNIPSSSYKSSLSLKNVCDSVLSSQNHNAIAGSSFVQASSSNMFPSHDTKINVPELQDQPLNLCKQKGKMFTTSHQQLIDHLVDKFLCEPVSPQSEPQAPDFSSNPLCTKVESNCQSFTLSAAIESAIDQAYSKDLPKLDIANTSLIKVGDVPQVLENTSTKNLPKSDSDDKTEVIFIDKIKKACLASSRNSQEKVPQNHYSHSQTTSTNSAWVEPDSSVSILDKSKPVTSPNQNEKSDSLLNRSAIPKKVEMKYGSSKYYSKFASPPKKSQIWCNLFMREQLENSDSEGSTDAKKIAGYDLAFPVRRNSQRTCKGRRYQELITEGLLQSTKERKPGAGRKPFTAVEKSKGKSLSLSDSPPPMPVKSKKKKREALAKSKSLEKEDDNEEGSDVEKSVFDLNEKIASLPKCSLETLNKKRKLNSTGKGSSTERDVFKTSKETNVVNVEEMDLTSTKTQQQDSSSRFKTGSFDLEQHIASLPRCDIEVLNKRRSKKEGIA